jgi:CRISPR/Cas system endoribonuclease Cas6 (RAMP superfamily)
MSASETMPSQGTSTFDLFALRFEFVANGTPHLPPLDAANLFRGQFGKVLYRRHPELYARLFAPAEDSGVPSGLHDPPRPFVLRVRHLERGVLNPFHVGLNSFETNQPHIAEITDSMLELVRENLHAELLGIEGTAILHLPLTSRSQANRLRVHFLTPTELKPPGPPKFGTLFARIRDRISTLRSLYGPGPLEIDFKAMGDRASAVSTTYSDFHHVHAERVSRNTGQRHPLGGFTGVAEYEGDLTEFIPYLEIAGYTGVGRQTVWGKGEIRIETF